MILVRKHSRGVSYVGLAQHYVVFQPNSRGLPFVLIISEIDRYLDKLT